MPEYPGFVGGFQVAQSPAWANARTVNFYVEPGDRDTKTAACLLPLPGVSTIATVSGQTRGRAAFEEDGRAFLIVGERLIEVLSDWTTTERGTVVEGAPGSPARIVSLGDASRQLLITSGDHAYSFDLSTNTLTEVFTSGAAQCESIDGFGLVLDPTDSSISASELSDASTAAKFVGFKQRDALSDPWQAIKVIDRLVYLFGERTSDIYYDAGLSPFPLAQHTAGAFPFGIAAPNSVAVVGDRLCWLGRSASAIGMVLAAKGSSAQEISTPALRWVIDGYRRSVGIGDAEGEAFEYLGHQFYKLTFPAAEATWLYDLSTGVWVEWLTWLSAEGRYAAWQPSWHVIAHGQQLVVNRTSNVLHRIEPASALDATGLPMRRLRRPPPLFMEGKRVILDDFDLFCETGIAPSTADPLVELRYSKDQGKTWAPASSYQSAGAIGEYGVRLSWPRLGQARDWQFEVVCSSNYPYRLHGASIQPRTGGGR